MALLLHACSGSGNKPVTTSLERGGTAPEITLPDISGNIHSLSNLKGNFVLIDFWAAWCRPCRRVNPQLVALNEKYKNTDFGRGSRFYIYSISLDTDRGAWLTAVRDDKLEQLINLSDLKGANSPASRAYDVQLLPSSFLIDPEGKIVAINLHPRELDNLLQNYIVQH